MRQRCGRTLAMVMASVHVTACEEDGGLIDQWDPGTAFAEPRCLGKGPSCGGFQRLRGGPTDCHAYWPLGGWKPGRAGLSARSMAELCTPERTRVLKAAKIDCYSLQTSSKWQRARARLTKVLGSKEQSLEVMGVLNANSTTLGYRGAKRAFITHWQFEALRDRLPQRNATCPWLVNARYLSCGNASTCGSWFSSIILGRDDLIWLNYDLSDHLLTRNDAPLTPGITIWPTCKVCGQLERQWPLSPFVPRRLLLSYQGNCQPGWFNSSEVRPHLRRLFSTQRDANRIHWKCSGPSAPDPGFEPDEYVRSFDTDFMLVPHGDNRFNYRFSEAIAAGAIPVIIADGLTLPLSQLINWSGAAIRIPEADVLAMKSPSELVARLPTGRRLQELREAVFSLSNQYFHGVAAATRELALVRAARIESAKRQTKTELRFRENERSNKHPQTLQVADGNSDVTIWRTQRPQADRHNTRVPLSHCSPQTPAADCKRSFSGGPDDCFEVWNLATWRPNGDVFDDAHVASWCTAAQTTLFRSAGIECQSLRTVADWKRTSRALESVGKHAGSLASVSVPEVLTFRSERQAFAFWWKQHALRHYLPRRNSTCPWVVNFGGFTCGNSTRCGNWFDAELVRRDDIIWANVDLGDHVLSNDSAQLSPGITLWPPCKRCHEHSDWPHHPFKPRKFLVTFQGNCQPGWFNSTNVRPKLRALLSGQTQTHPRVHFRCSGPGQPDPGFDPGDYSSTFDSDYVLVPHGDGRWNYRFSEAIAAGAIPVIIADGLTLPFSQLINWTQAAVRIPEADVSGMRSIDDLLSRLPHGVELQRLRETVHEISAQYFYGSFRLARELAVAQSVRKEIQNRQARASTEFDKYN